MFINRFFFLSLMITSIAFGTDILNLNKDYKNTIERLIAQCSLLTSYPEDKLPQTLYNDLITNVQDLLETMDPKEKNRRELEERNKVAQQIAWQRVATEKQSQEVPLLSFVIPCHNRANVIQQTIESIYNQNLTIPFEVIAVDDASEDNTFEVLQSYEEFYDNFFAYKHDVNKKAPTTRNTGMLYARGKYICNADSDDLFGKDTIMPMLNAIIKKQYETCYFENMTQFETSIEPSNLCVQSNAPNNIFDLSFMLKNGIFAVSCGNRIFSKQSWLAIGGYLQEPGHDSWSFSFRMHARGYTGYIHPGSQNYFRIWRNKSSMWWQDNIHKVNDISPLHVALENLELFSEKSQKDLLNYDEPDGVFILSYAKQLKLLPEKVLRILFSAYRYEDNNDYTSACFAYDKAITKGANHPRIYLKQARAAIISKKFDLAAYSLYMLKNRP